MESPSASGFCQPGRGTERRGTERFRKTDIMENCCDVALYPLGLEPLERPVGLRLCSHLSDKEAGSEGVLPDVVFVFQAVSQSLTPSRHMCARSVGLGLLWLIFNTVWASLRAHGNSNGVTRLCFVSLERGGKQQSRCRSLPCLVAPYAAKGCR